jgi:hypothetical protein
MFTFGAAFTPKKNVHTGTQLISQNKIPLEMLTVVPQILYLLQNQKVHYHACKFQPLAHKPEPDKYSPY